MSQITGLPLEFKLLLKGKVVGYENHITIGKQGGCLHIMHSVDGENWQHVYNRTNYLFHDEKRQWTGFKDKNREKIYFGDKMKHMTLLSMVLRFDSNFVIIINDMGNIVAINKNNSQRNAGKHFHKMELTDG